ncbi:MAG: hypothetical protein KY468_20395, partial [Armatimonadetes bacterium]|nr:hypothetical protein [Armatimonadota bacterium]
QSGSHAFLGCAMQRRLRLYRGERHLPDVSDRTVILVDDGLATGVTARAAVRSIRLSHPRRIVLAAPVCAAESAAGFRTEVDDLVCVEIPTDFRAVGFWYRNFDQTPDEEVITLLERARQFGQKDSESEDRGQGPTPDVNEGAAE